MMFSKSILRLKFFSVLFILLLAALTSCGKGGDTPTPVSTAPTNLSLDATVSGTSGNVVFKAAATNASNNKIKAMDELGKVAQLPEIKTVLFMNNPFYGEKSKEEMAPLVVKRIPQIETLDGKLITPAVRKAASDLD